MAPGRSNGYRSQRGYARGVQLKIREWFDVNVTGFKKLSENAPEMSANLNKMNPKWNRCGMLAHPQRLCNHFFLHKNAFHRLSEFLQLFPVLPIWFGWRSNASASNKTRTLNADEFVCVHFGRDDLLSAMCVGKSNEMIDI